VAEKNKKPNINNAKPVDPAKEMMAREMPDAKKNGAKDDMIRQEILQAHLPLVETIAANVSSGGKVPPSIAFKDLVSYGAEGLIKAWESFDNARGVQFKVYASYRIRGEILDKIRQEWKYRNPGSYKSFQNRASDMVSEFASNSVVSEGQEKGSSGGVQDVVVNSAIVYLLSMDEMEVASGLQGTKDPAEEVISDMEFSRERSILWEEIKNLTAPEKMLVNMFYVEDKNQKEIADALGYSKSKVSRLHMQLLTKLRTRLKRRIG
jgi:RNA polymerase sigma factor for flagellar operon FliA